MVNRLKSRFSYGSSSASKPKHGRGIAPLPFEWNEREAVSSSQLLFVVLLQLPAAGIAHTRDGSPTMNHFLMAHVVTVTSSQFPENDRRNHCECAKHKQ
jgi:hypothetical protein